LVLWHASGAIHEWLGLDSVLGLFLQLALFALVGVGCGALLRFFPRAGSGGEGS